LLSEATAGKALLNIKKQYNLVEIYRRGGKKN
jgi:hypothetical protein